MDINVQKSLTEHVRKNRRRKVWKRILSTLSCLVVFTTTYALILPAITIENTSYCGIEEHLHDDSCYEKHLLCELPEEESIHTHTDTCKAVVQNIICGFEETEGHIHTETCFEEQTVQVCGLEEEEPKQGHVHAEACFDSEGTLVCSLEEEAPQQGHMHAEECYQTEMVNICGQVEQEAHTHSESCYVTEEIFGCGLEEGQILEAHVHTDDCYSSEFACEKAEHTHIAICFSNPEADLETKADWEGTLPDELTGVWADDVLAVAESQLGYSESANNFTVDENGEQKGYTRYGAWYGDRYGHWCAMYVRFCLYYAGVNPDYVPFDSNCQTWIDLLSDEQYDLYREAAQYEPVPGDIVFFDWNLDGTADHVGILAEQIAATEIDTAKLRTIEGNSENCVQYNTYDVGNPTIMGYIQLPENDGQNQNLIFQTVQAAIYTDETFETIDESDETFILIEGDLPEGAYAKAYPVELDVDLIEGKRIVLAYDITLYDADGNLLDIESKEPPMTVTIQPADWTEISEEPESESYDIYYIPEEGEPEKMETAELESAVSFQTEHFSTFALVAGGKMNNVYVNGSSGRDTYSGSQSAPVKTFEKAMELVARGGTIYVSGTITVNDDQVWDLQGQNVTIKRGTNFTSGPLVTVSSGGSLTLANVTVNGGSADPSSSNIATNSTYASGSAQAPLIVVNDNGRLTIKGGATLTNNSNKPTIRNNKFVENGYIGLGGAVYCQGTLVMEGGLIQKCEAQCGGGVYVENGDFYMNGGTIDQNYARDGVSYLNRVDNFHKNAGGGVYVGDEATMTMTGGTISNNMTSREGGGISLGWLERGDNTGIDSYITTFTMNGGTITGNYAVMTGGALNITAGRQAFINAGYLTYNQADGKEYQNTSSKVTAGNYSRVYSGGAIYIDAAQWSRYPNYYSGVPGKAVINRALITQNKATEDGGGIAACGTSESYIYGTDTNGTAIYNNTRNGYSDEVYVYGTAKKLGKKLLGGGNYNWETSSSSGATWYDNSLTDSSAAIVKAKELATVFITNNTAYLGGGIGCNGLIEIGGEEEESTYINIKKEWNDDGTIEHPEFIEVQILQDGEPYGEPKRIYRTFDENGNEVWPTFYVGGLPSTDSKGNKYTYTVQELDVPGYVATIEKTGQDFIITNTPTGFQVKKKWLDAEGNELTEDFPDYIEVQLYQNGVKYGDVVLLTATKKWGHIWTELPEADEDGNPYIYTAKELNIPDGYISTGESTPDEKGNCVIINRKSAQTSISVEKKWADGEIGAASVTVQLLRNGENYRDPVQLNSDNKWFYKWEDLPIYNADGSEFTYEVVELPVKGYSSTVTEGSTNLTYSRWVVANTFEPGTQYMIVSSDGALADDGSGGLTGVDVSAALVDGSMPSNTSVLWTRDSSDKLKNTGSGKYVYYQSDKFTTNASSSTAVSYSDRKLSATTYYLGFIPYQHYLTDISGLASDTKGNGMEFTLYKYVEELPDYGDKHFIVTNTKKPGSISVNFAKYSVSGEDLRMLAGAELELYKSGDGSTEIPGTEENGTLIGQWTSEMAESESGGIHTLELEAGTYYLIETKVPEGHAGLSGPIIFTVDVNNGNVTIVNYPDREDVTVTVNGDGTADLPIYNESIFELPETGGIGTNVFLASGTLLILIGLLYGYCIMRRHERRFK